MVELVVPLALGALAWAALHDLAARTIPNAIPALLLAFGLAVRLQEGEVLWGLGAAILVFALALLAWRFGVMGGGDAKLLGACALLPPPGDVPAMVVAVALCGGLLTLPYLVFRRRALAIPAPSRSLPARALRAEIWRLRRGGPLPYAVAILGGVSFTLAQ